MRGLVFFLGGLLVAGCAGPPPKKGATEKPEPRIETGSGAFRTGVAEKYDNQGRPIWKLSIKRGSVSVSDAGAAGSFEEFEGGFYRKGQLAGWVVAKAGSADSASGIVSCSGGVRYGSKAHRTELVADRLEWRSKQDLLIAAGNVEVRQGGFYLGKLNLAFADTEAGQVWMDAKEATMKLKTAVLPVLGAAVAVMGAQQQVRRFDTVTLSNFTSFRIDLSNLDEVRATCKGNPASLSATEQGVQVSAQTLEATIVRKEKTPGGETEFVLQRFVASGGTNYSLSLLDPLARAGKGAKPTTVAGTADRATYDRATGKLTLSGKVVAILKDPDRFEEPGLRNEADECVVTFDPATNRPLEMEFTSKTGSGRSTGALKAGSTKKP